MELFRITHYSAKSLYGYRVTEDQRQREFLEREIEADHYPSWHPLIKTSFQSSPLVKQTRFRPSFGKRAFYASEHEETVIYEAAYHIMKEQRHNVADEIMIKNIFSVDADATNAINITNDPNISAIMNKNDYSASHQFIAQHPQHSFILYPSCRDPNYRDNAAIFDINLLAKNPTGNPKWESTIKFIYDHRAEQLTCVNYNMTISWQAVS